MMIRPLDDRISCVRSAFTHLGLWRKLYDRSRRTSQSANVFSNVLRRRRPPTVRLQIARGFFSTPPPRPVWGFKGGHEWSRMGHSIARSWVHISSPLSHMVNLLSFLSYLAGSKSATVCRPGPFDPDTMTMTTLSIGNK